MSGWTCKGCSDALCVDCKDARIRDLEAALRDACELAEDGIGYTDEYFVTKWEMRERLAEARAVLEKRGGG